MRFRQAKYLWPWQKTSCQSLPYISRIFFTKHPYLYFIFPGCLGTVPKCNTKDILGSNSSPVILYIQSALAIPDLAIPDTLLYRIVESQNFLYRQKYLVIPDTIYYRTGYQTLRSYTLKYIQNPLAIPDRALPNMTLG